MNFDPNFPEKFPYLCGIFSENPSTKSQIPIVDPLQKPSNHVLPTLNNISMYNPDNFNHFQHNLPLDRANLHLDFENRDPSSTINSFFTVPIFSLNDPYNGANCRPDFETGDPSPTIDHFFTIPTFSSDDPYKNGSSRDLVNPRYPKVFPPNNNKAEDEHGYINNGKDIEDFSDKVHVQCGARSQPRVGPSAHEMTNMIKGQWTPDEDRDLIELVGQFGLAMWSHIAKLLNGRTGKQCRERWYNHLQPDIKKDSWTEEEEKILIEAHKEVGNKWTEISKRLPGRTENTIKNHFNATKRRKNAKRQKNNLTNSNGTLLQNYIMNVTTGEKEFKKSKSKMNFRSEDRNDQSLLSVRYQSLEGEASGTNKNTQIYGQDNDEVYRSFQLSVPTINRNDGYVPMMANTGEIASGFVMHDNTM